MDIDIKKKALENTARLSFKPKSCSNKLYATMMLHARSGPRDLC